MVVNKSFSSLKKIDIEVKQLVLDPKKYHIKVIKIRFGRVKITLQLIMTLNYFFYEKCVEDVHRICYPIFQCVKGHLILRMIRTLSFLGICRQGNKWFLYDIRTG